MTIDQNTLDAFMGRFVGDLGATVQAATVVIGDKLGLYKALDVAGPSTSSELAGRDRHPRALRARVAPRRRPPAATSRTTPTQDRYHLSPEQVVHAGAATTARPSSRAPTRSPPPPSATPSRWPTPSGPAPGWAGTSTTSDLFEGTERFFRPGYLANLVDGWIPALDGVDREADGRRPGGRRRLRARRLHDPAGPGVSRPRRSSGSTTTSPPSRWRAKARGRRPGSPTACEFAVADADRPTPAPATTWSRSSTACTTWATRSVRPGTCASRCPPDGTWMVVEPFASDRVEDNLNPVGRVYYNASTLICVPASARPGASARRWAPRPARAPSARSPRRPASAGSAGPPRPRSTSSSKHDPDGRPAAGPTQRRSTP